MGNRIDSESEPGCPMGYDLNGKTIAILATDAFEESELVEPRKALEESGADVRVVSPKGGLGTTIRSWDHTDWGDEVVEVDLHVAEADAEDFDGLLIPGGVMNPDALRADDNAVDFVKGFFAQHKPVAAICHGPWLIVEAGAAQGRRMTSYHSIRTDVQNAGATWVDERCVVDGRYVSAQIPRDLPAFMKAILEIAETE